MGWPGGEAHRFRVGDTLYGNTSDGAHPRDSRWVTLGDVVGTGADSFRYELGFDDENWECDVLIESVAEGTADNQRPLCLAGEHAWPLERQRGPDASLDRVDRLAAETFRRGRVRRRLHQSGPGPASLGERIYDPAGATARLASTSSGRGEPETH